MHIISPKSCLKRLSHLGDPVTTLGRCPCKFTFFCAVCPRTVHVFFLDSSRLVDSSEEAHRRFGRPFRQKCVLQLETSFVLRIVRACLPDSPPLPGGQSTVARRTVRFVRRKLPSLIGSFASFLVLPLVFQGIVPRTCSYFITMLSWLLVVDSTHHSCVTRI
jgi:hypothetical protein